MAANDTFLSAVVPSIDAESPLLTGFETNTSLGIVKEQSVGERLELDVIASQATALETDLEKFTLPLSGTNNNLVGSSDSQPSVTTSFDGSPQLLAENVDGVTGLAGVSALSAQAVNALAKAGDELYGDIDGDGDTDNEDLQSILSARNTVASGPDDPRDLDGDGRITALDGRAMILHLRRNQDDDAPVIVANLRNDTGSVNNDGITLDPAVTGSVKDSSRVTRFWAGLDDAAPASFTETSSILQADGRFALALAQLEQINGGTLADGKHTLYLQAKDEWGNQTDRFELTFTLDTTGPVLNVTSNLAGTPLTTDSRLQGTAIDAVSGIVSLSYRFGDGDEVSVPVDASGVFDSPFKLGDLEDGQHTLTVTAIDRAGNIETTSFTVTVGIVEDTAVPIITAALVSDTGENSEDAVTSNPSIAGTVTDTSQIGNFKAGFNNTPTDDFVDVLTALQPNGRFLLDAAALTAINNGTALSDGVHTLKLIATDTAGNVSDELEFKFTLDTTAPTAFAGSVTESDTTLDIAFDETVNAAAFAAENYSLVVASGNDAGTAIEVTAAERGNERTVQLSLASPLTTNASYTLAIDSAIQDLAGNALAPNTSLDISVDPPTIELHPIHGEERVAINRKTVIRFEKEVDPSTVTDETVYLIANGEKLPGRLEVSSTNKFATFIPTEPLPASTEVRVVVKGDEIKTLNGVAFDGDLDGLAGGTATADFTTVPLTQIEGTNIFGYVYDSYNRNSDGSNKPIAGVTIRVDGLPDVFAVTDENGYFKLEDLPAPDVYVFIDGSTATGAPEGTQYASLGKPFHSIPGQEVQLTMDEEPFDIFLPPMAMEDVQELSATEETEVGFGAEALALLRETLPNVEASVWEAVKVTFPPGAARDDEGNAATQAMIVPVDPSRLPAPPPPHLDPKLVISIQAGGENGFNQEAEGGSTYFDVPAPVVFPNLDGLAAGEKATLFSFDHEAGHWVPIGLGTVSEDGAVIESDPGVGILAPGWHFVSPPLNWGMNGNPPEEDTPFNKDIDLGVEVKLLANGDADVIQLNFPVPPGASAKEGQHEFPQGDKTPVRDVNIIIRGPFDEFYENSGPNKIINESFRIFAGEKEPVIREAKLRDLQTILTKNNGGKPFDKDVLYGAEIIITDILTLADGSKITSRKTKIPYLYIDQSDDNSTDRKLKFSNTAEPGEIIRARDFDLKIGDAPKPKLIFEGGNPGDFIGSLEEQKLKFNPSALGTQSPTLKVEVSVEGQTIKSQNAGIDVEGTGTDKTTIYLNKPSFLGVATNHDGLVLGDADALYGRVKTQTERRRDQLGGNARQALVFNDAADNGAGPKVNVSWNFSDQEVLFIDRDGNRHPSPDEIIDINGNGTLDRGEYIDSDFSGTPTPGEIGFNDSNGDGVPDPGEFIDLNGSGTLDLNGEWVDLNQNGSPFDSNALLGGADDLDFNKNSFVDVFINNRADYGKAQQAFLMDTLFNRRNVSSYTLYLDNHLGPKPVPNHVLLGDTVLHETSHTFGLVHSDNMGLAGGIGGHFLDDFMHHQSSRVTWTNATRNAVLMAIDATYSVDDVFDHTIPAFIQGYNNRHLPPHDPFENAHRRDGIGDAPVGPRFAMLDVANQTAIFDNVAFSSVASDGIGNQSQTVSLLIGNPGGQDLIINNIFLSEVNNGFLVSGFTPGEIIEPGTSLAFDLTFDPTVIGELTNTLFIDTNTDGVFPADENGLISLQLNGFGVNPDPALDLDISNNNFGGTPIGSSTQLDQFLTITNTGATDLTFTPTLLKGQADFSLGDFEGVEQTLAYNETLTIPVTFTPTTTGLLPGLIQFTTNDPDQPTFTQGIVGTGILDGPLDFDWGNDFVAIEYNNFLQRTTSNDAGSFMFELPTFDRYDISIFDPDSGLIAQSGGFTGPAGALTDLTTGLTFRPSEAPDTDFDGLPDDIEFAIGTDITEPDTDGDGLSDFAEINNGLNAINGQGFPTGIIASLPLRGEANAVVVEGSTSETRDQLAYIATGSYGLAIVDASEFDNPIILGQLDLPGNALDVAVDPILSIAAVATQTGLQLVDVSDPMLPELLQTIDLRATQVELYDGLAYATIGGSIQAINLFTGEVQQALPISGRLIQTMARDDAYLYTFDGSKLYVIDTTTKGGASVVGQLSVGTGRITNRLTVGEGIAYLAGFGVRTIDVSNPTSPKLISNYDLLLPSQGMGLNGSGLAVVASANQGATVYDITDPNNTDAVLAQIDTPGNAVDVAIASGIAYVADGRGGLQVINYLPFDTQGEAPTVNISSSVIDEDPTQPGAQITEASSISIQVDAQDDVQISNVEILVNGEVLAKDVSFPFDTIVPAFSSNPDTNVAAIQARVTDTGGNSNLSNILTFDLQPDTSGPSVIDTTPDNDARLRFVNGMFVRFDEPLDPDQIDPNRVTFTYLGEDGKLGGGDDRELPLPDLKVSESGRTLFVFAPEEDNFIPGPYQFQLNAGAVKDRVGNSLDNSFSLDFTKRVVSHDLTIGKTISHQIFAPGENEIYTFTGTSGQNLYFDGLSSMNNINATLVDPRFGRTIFSTATDLDRPFTLPYNGIYRLTIDSQDDTTGDYSFRLIDVSEAEVLTFNDVVSRKLESAKETHIFQFSARPGQEVSFDRLDTLNDVRFTLYDPSNNIVDLDEPTLSQAGKYLLAVTSSSNAPIDYQFQMTRPGVTSLSLGDVVESNISESGEQDMYTFAGTVDQILYFDGLGENSRIRASLISPSGKSIGIVNLPTTEDSPLFKLTEVGEYQLAINGISSTTGNYSFQLSDLTTAPVLALDVLQEERVSPADKKVFFRFEGTAGQKLLLDSHDFRLPHYRRNGTYTIYDSNGERVTSTIFSQDREITLPNDGDYVLAIEGPPSATTSYRYHFQLLQVVEPFISERTYELGSVSGLYSRIYFPGETHVYTFDAREDQRIYYDGRTGNPNLNIRLLDPDGSKVFELDNESSREYDDIDKDTAPITLEETGTYQLIVDGDGASTGSYEFGLFDIDTQAEELYPGEGIGTTLDAGYTDLYRFEGYSGQVIELSGTGDDNNGEIILFGPNDYDSEIISMSLTDSNTVRLFDYGTYVIAVKGNSKESVEYFIELDEV